LPHVPERPPSLRSLAAFEAAARRLSFAKAAEELNLTPGAVSHAVGVLETRLGEKLFARVGRGVALTKYGQTFAARVRLGLSLITDAFSADIGEGPRSLTVSTLPSIASKVLLPGLQRIRETISGLELELRVTEDLESFAGKDVDLAVRFGPGDWAGVTSRRLAQETLFPVCSPAFLRRHKLSEPRDMQSCDLIGHPSSSWKLWLDPLGLDFKAFRPWLIVEDAAFAIDAACQSQGIALARGVLAREDLAAGRLVRLFMHEVRAEYEYACVYRSRSPKAALISRFMDWLSDEMAQSAGPQQSIHLGGRGSQARGGKRRIAKLAARTAPA
jgi:LysR family transcriptional regulator, glycine cleavage system transcriptional activator